MTKIEERLSNIRAVMHEKLLSAVVLPTGDPHISEYPSEHWASREWASGFTGSAGTLVITKDRALLWTDGRYYIQAAEQLDGTTIQFQRGSDLGCPTISEWLCENLEAGNRVGYDGHQITADAAKKIRTALKKKNIELILDVDPVDGVWEERPPLPNAKAFVHEPPFCGQSVSEKIKQVRTDMAKKDATHYLVSSLDDVAWLLNIRGADIPWTPLVLAFVLVGIEEMICFIDDEKCPATVKDHFAEFGVIILPYDAIDKTLGTLGATEILLLDPKKTCSQLYDAVASDCNIKEIKDILQSMKAVKSNQEIENIRKCSERDCKTIARVLRWIDKSLEDNDEISELSVSRKIEAFRGEDERYIGPSFETIAAYGEHAALMHYAVTSESDVPIEKSGFLLIDTGGQYLDGTTDITRTVACGKLTEQQRRDYTLVLKGHIALSQAVFLEGTCGPHLDILARGVLAKEGLNYRCGTGHSVGYCLNVHEGPHGITNGSNMIPLKPGMIVTNEPGIYREGAHGIRIENTLLVCEHSETESGKFFAFEILSYCPIDMRPVIKELLTVEEKSWIEHYHEKVLEMANE